MESKKKLIAGCLKSNRKAQKCLYEKYAPEMINVCLRYCGDRHIAEEVMLEGFLSVFKHLGQLKDPKKLKPWIKRIMVNSALMKMRKREKLIFYNNESLDEKQKIELFADESYQYTENDLRQIFIDMPKGYKMIFNMYAYDDFSHKEIAEILNISESTSKSQLSRARNHLKTKLNDLKLEYCTKTRMYGLICSISWFYDKIS